MPHTAKYVLLSNEERRELLLRLLGSNVVGAMDALRVARVEMETHPRDRARQKAYFDRYEDLLCEQVNHLYSICGTLVTGPIERLMGRLDAVERALREREVGE